MINKLILRKDFKDRHRIKTKYFTRKGKLEFDSMILFTLKSRKKTTQIELNKFFSEAKLKDKSVPTASAYFQNRLKMSSDFAKEIMDHVNKEFYKNNEDNVKLYKGMRLLAIDGSIITLPQTKELEEKYGYPVSRNGDKGLISGQLSCLFDLNNKMILDTSLEPYKASERAQAIKHLDYCNSKDLIILDRGYPSYEIISEIESKKSKYLVRCKSNANGEVIKFISSNLEDVIVDYKVPKEKKKIYGKNSSKKIRLIKIKLKTGETEILMTNLLAKEQFPYSIFEELYFKRWGIETNYDVLKNILEIENLSSYKEKCILQDIYSTQLLRNLQSIMSIELEKEIQKKYEHRKYKYKINTSITIGALNENLISLFTNSTPITILKKLKKVFISNVIPIRPNRQEKRKKDKYGNRKKPWVLKNRKRVL